MILRGVSCPKKLHKLLRLRPFLVNIRGLDVFVQEAVAEFDLSEQGVSHFLQSLVKFLHVLLRLYACHDLLAHGAY